MKSKQSAITAYLINKHAYRYTLSSFLCSNTDELLLAIVMPEPGLWGLYFSAYVFYDEMHPLTFHLNAVHS